MASLQAQPRQQITRALAMKVDAAAIDQIETVADTVGRQYEAFGPRAVLAIRQGQADLTAWRGHRPCQPPPPTGPPAAPTHWATRSTGRYLLAYSYDMAAEAHPELGQSGERRQPSTDPRH